MIRFKNHNHSGFTLAEIMLALFIMATLLSSIIVLLQNSVQVIGFFSHKLEYVLQLRSLFVEKAMERAQAIDKEQTEKKTDTNSITVVVKKPEKNSSLSSLKNIAIETARARWKEGVYNRSAALITFLYKPEKKKS